MRKDTAEGAFNYVTFSDKILKCEMSEEQTRENKERNTQSDAQNPAMLPRATSGREISQAHQRYSHLRALQAISNEFLKKKTCTVFLSRFSINLPAFYNEWRALIGYATHYLFCDR